MKEDKENQTPTGPGDKPESISGQLQTALIVCQALGNLGSGLIKVSEQVGGFAGEVERDIRDLKDKITDLHNIINEHVEGCSKCRADLSALLLAERSRGVAWKTWTIRAATVVAMLGLMSAVFNFMGIEMVDIINFLVNHARNGTTP
jgi:hypothetical protein